VPLAERKSVLRIAAVTLLASGELFLLRLAPLSALGKALLGAVLFFGTIYAVLLALKDPVLTETADAIRSRLKGRNIG
jgi:hypothetical protein